MLQIPAEEAEHKAPSKERSKAKSIEWPSPSDPVPFWERPVTPLAGDAAKLGDGGVSQDPNPMHIVHVTAEMAPLAKVILATDKIFCSRLSRSSSWYQRSRHRDEKDRQFQSKTCLPSSQKPETLPRFLPPAQSACPVAA